MAHQTQEMRMKTWKIALFSLLNCGQTDASSKVVLGQVSTSTLPYGVRHIPFN